VRYGATAFDTVEETRRCFLIPCRKGFLGRKTIDTRNKEMRIDKVNAGTGSPITKQRGDDHQPPGTGSIDWYRVTATLSEADFHGAIILELAGRLETHELSLFPRPFIITVGVPKGGDRSIFKDSRRGPATPEREQ
jgi:hypothetical protein